MQSLQAQLESQAQTGRAGADAESAVELEELRATVTQLQGDYRSQGAAETERLLSELKFLRQQVQQVCCTASSPHFISCPTSESLFLSYVCEECNAALTTGCMH